MKQNIVDTIAHVIDQTTALGLDAEDAPATSTYAEVLTHLRDAAEAISRARTALANAKAMAAQPAARPGRRR